jgi:protocatechuate 3,4-dioxygenase beta subunit
MAEAYQATRRLHRRHVLLGLLTGTAGGAGASWLYAQSGNASPAKPPSGDEPADVRALIDRAQTALQAGRTVSDVLADGTFMPARPWTRFRTLIEKHATADPLTLVPASEPGDLLLVRGTVRDARGRPAARAMIYLYHTSARGWYSATAAHVGGNSGDYNHARLFGYLKTDAAGRYSVRTIRPASYDGTTMPAHIHVTIQAAQGSAQPLVTEILFEDDPHLPPADRDRARQHGVPVCRPQREANGVQAVQADFRVQ